MHAFKRKLKELGRRTPWWGISFLVHAIAILIMMNWKVESRYRRPEITEPVHIASILPDEPKPPPYTMTQQVAPDPPVIEPPIEKAKLGEVEDSAASDAALKVAETRVIEVEGGAWARRTPGCRGRLTKEGGGPTEGSENAVEHGLMWLARNQQPTGGWRAESEGARWAEPGISALGTMSFLGAGYTHKKGKFFRVVDSALGYLKGKQDREGCIAYTEDGKRGGGYMYCHPMATLALVEAYGMTKDLKLQEPAQRAIDFICRTQNSTGGWRYYANSPDGDSSISGWMVMALRSATLSGLDVPSKAMDEARRFFDSVTDKPAGKTNYMRGLPMGLALNAVGLLCHQYLGMASDDPYIEKAGAFINANPPKWHDKDAIVAMPLDKLALFTATNNYYYWYYANLALHQRRGKQWDKWHEQVRDLLCRIQERGGEKDGSWPPVTYGGTTGGRVYTTALGILTLEVYYRYAPMYRETVDEVAAAFGDALGAYNHFVRLPDRKKPEAAEARKTAIEKLNAFLALAETKGGKSDPAKTEERRGQATRMLIDLHRAGGEIEEAVALLKSLPARFPNLMPADELVRLLADLHRALAQQLADAGEAEKAKQAKAIALNLYYPVLIKSLGKHPELELWAARGFFEREEWQKALDLYKPQVARLDLKRLDPKSEEGRTVLRVFDCLVKCATSLRMYEDAEKYLGQIEKLVGPTLASRRQRAELRRLRKDYVGARLIYQDILLRVPEFGRDWWEAKYDQLLMAYLENRTTDVVKAIGRLQISHPELGGDDFKPRFLDLLSRAQNDGAPTKAVPDSSSP